MIGALSKTVPEARAIVLLFLMLKAPVVLEGIIGV